MVSRLRAGTAWVWAQLTGFLANVWRFVFRVDLPDLLPPWIVDTFEFIVDVVPYSLGFTESPFVHLVSVISVSIAITALTFGFATLLAVFFLIGYGAFAVLRFFPAVDKRWPYTASDWPLWEVGN